MTETLYRIHPAIGIARLGNAPRSDEGGWLIGPERPGIPAGYDPCSRTYESLTFDGRIRAQAARFRLYRYEGDHTTEVTLSNPAGIRSITWRVELANRKAAFFKFYGPLGRGSLYGNPLLWAPPAWRNRRVRPREDLVQSCAPARISWTHGPGRVEMRNQNLRTSKLGIENLGELRVDGEGRLVVLAGCGRSVFVSEFNAGTSSDQSLKDYANNDGWFDDVSDGPVSAVLELEDGRSLTVEGENGAWVIGAPPDFAPAVSPVRSMYDTLIDAFVRERPKELISDRTMRATYWPAIAKDWDPSKQRLRTFKPSFSRDIYPLLRAAAGIRGVFSVSARPIAHLRFDEQILARLALPDSSAASDRQAVFDHVRPPGSRAFDLTQMPLAWGDSWPLEASDSGRGFWGRLAARLRLFPRPLLTVSPLQYAILERWVAGEFLPDWQPGLPTVATGPIAPYDLDRAALEHAAGGAFFPGIESSWLFADVRVFTAPFRIAVGRTLRKWTALGAIRVQPGLFTAQMALPWQADFASCAKSRGVTGLTNVAWWPSQRPDDVYVSDSNTGLLAQVPWTRGADASSDENERHQRMVHDWSKRGFVIEDQHHGFIEQPR